MIPYSKLLKYAATVPLIVGCVNLPTVSPQIRAATEQQITRTYECVWYEYINGDEATSDKLIDRAIVEAKMGGVPDSEIMAIYSRARAAQKLKVTEEATRYALEARPPKIENIMGDTTVKPTIDENKQALLNLYREQCDQTP